MENALVIPSYEPSLRLIKVLDGILSMKEFDYVYVVDDGSGEKYSPLFEEIRKKNKVTVLSYMPNRGKGAALKTAFFDITLHHPSVSYIVTADSDGQHLVKDIVRVSEASKMAPTSLVMGTRDFLGENVPFNSKWGNRISCLYYRLSTRQKISDTQTGLRAIPKSLFPLALETRGDRYDYEMNFLMAASKVTSVISVPIQTVYEEKNKCSHFRVIRDSFLIYKTPVLYCLVAILSALIDYGLFYILDTSLSFPLVGKIGLATIIARLISGAFNFALLNSIVFPSGKDLGGRSLRYLILFIVNMSLSFGLVYLLALMSPISAVILKIFVEITIFILDFGLNSFVVFASKRSHNHQRAKEGGNMSKEMTLALIVGVVGALGLTGGVASNLLGALVIDEAAGSIASSSSSSSSWSGHIGLTSTSSSSSVTEDSSSQASSNPSSSSASSSSGSSSISSSSSSSSSSSVPSKTSVTYLLKTVTNKHSKSVKIHLLDIELSSIEHFKTNIVTKNGSFGYGSSYMATVGSQFETLKSSGEDIIGAMNGDDCFYSSSMKRKGYVIRNGVSYRSSVRSDASDYDDCVIYRDGTMSSFNENDYSCEEVVNAGAYHVFDFGPSLVKGGAINVSTTDEVDQSAGANPRSVLAYLGGLHYLFFVSEGRLNNSSNDSLTLYEAASFLKDYGVKEAYNLDGGGSSTMIYEGAPKNATCNSSTSTQRKVSDCLYAIG